MRRLRAYAPASIGNVAAGFDILGAALAPLEPPAPADSSGGGLWGDVVELAEGPPGLRVEGPYAHRLPPEPEENLVLRAFGLFRAALGREVVLPAVTLHKRLPVKSGLGSSSASAVAALVAFNAWEGEPLGRAALLELAGRTEELAAGAPHLDNVAPSLLGGLRLVTDDGAPRALPFPDGLLFAVVHPDLELATAAARAVLPRQVPLADAVCFAQNLAGFVHALDRGDLGLLRRCLRDPLAEPFRAGLVPGFREAQRAALAAGALGCSLSGAGPATFAVAEAELAAGVASGMQEAFAAAGATSTARLCRLDLQGARILP
ncbi:MAG TPA: homoserine kinase [Thermoanaerobaculia bacterium]|nr:homoserine kinase [Thermoanaerobaculia bacterium]